MFKPVMHMNIKTLLVSRRFAGGDLLARTIRFIELWGPNSMGSVQIFWVQASRSDRIDSGSAPVLKLRVAKTPVFAGVPPTIFGIFVVFGGLTSTMLVFVGRV